MAGEDAIRASILQEMFVATRRLRSVFDARVRQRGMTYSRARLILHLVKMPRSTQAELADALEVERPTMARLIDGLEKCGLVAREAADEDRRVRRIALTDAAQEQVEDLMAMTRQLRLEALDGVTSDDLAATQRVLARITANLSAAS